jgi:hypothetical protein
MCRQSTVYRKSLLASTLNSKRKEVNHMNYKKPEINLVAGAVAAIQDLLEKSNQVPDGIQADPNPASAAGYAADE